MYKCWYGIVASFAIKLLRRSFQTKRLHNNEISSATKALVCIPTVIKEPSWKLNKFAVYICCLVTI